MSGKGVPEDIKSRVLGLHEDNFQLKEQLKTVQDKLNKARAVRDFLFRFLLHALSNIPTPQFIKSQDKLFKEEQAKLRGISPSVRIACYQVSRAEYRVTGL